MIRQAVIVAGGLGTRLQQVTRGLPKALAEVGGVPVLGHQLGLCHRHGFNDVVLLLGHGAETIKAYVGDGSKFGLRIRSIVEKRPLGSAGAVLEILDELEEHFLVLYCDTMLDVDLNRFWQFHQKRKSGVSILVHPNDHPFDSDLVSIQSDGRILAFRRWCEDKDYAGNLVSAALYVIERASLASIKFSDPESLLDFGKDVFPELIRSATPIYGYRSVEYIKDMGTPERLLRVNRDLAAGKVRPGDSGRRRPAVFLDRDGTLNVERNGILNPEEMILLPGTIAGVRQLNESGTPTIVITNQPYVAHGRLLPATLERIHGILERDLAIGRAFVDAIYFCPHHPHSGYEGEVPSLKIDCDCRKPEVGMILQAADDLNLDISESWVIGDQTRDIETAHRAGLRSILVRTGYAGNDRAYDSKPDYVFDDIAAAAKFIVETYPRLRRKAQTLVGQLSSSGSTILIGGAPRSGKSTWGAVLEEAARDRGLVPVYLRMDDWRYNGLGSDPYTSDFYDLAALYATIDSLSRAKEETLVHIPIYDHRLRRRVGERSVLFSPGSPLFIEGISALALDLPGAVRFLVEAQTETRAERFRTLHRDSGLNEEDVQLLWVQQEAEEIIDLDKFPEVFAVLSGTGDQLSDY